MFIVSPLPSVLGAEKSLTLYRIPEVPDLVLFVVVNAPAICVESELIEYTAFDAVLLTLWLATVPSVSTGLVACE